MILHGKVSKQFCGSTLRLHPEQVAGGIRCFGDIFHVQKGTSDEAANSMTFMSTRRGYNGRRRLIVASDTISGKETSDILV